MNKIKEFLKSLINDNNPNSAKVFAGLITLVTIIFLSISTTIQNKGIVPEYIFNTLCLYSSAAFGISLFDHIKTIKKDENNTDNSDTTDNTNNQ